MDIIAGIQSALEIIGKLKAFSKKVQDADFNMLLAELTNQLADAKLEAANLKIELAKVKDENEQLAKRLSSKESAKPILSNGGYQFEGDDGLYCTGCFDSQQKKIRLARLTGAFSKIGKWKCPNCQNTFR